MAQTKVEDGKVLIAKTAAVKQELNALGRHYIVNDSIVTTYTKRYIYVENDTKLLRFAQGSMGSLSDTFILYSVAMLGVCDKMSMANFLLALSVKNPSLRIADPTDNDAFRARVKELVNNGFLFRNAYTFDALAKGETDKTDKQESVLYTIDEGAIRFMCQKLGYRIMSNQWIGAKPVEELIAWADTAYIASLMALDKGFSEFKQGIFKCKELNVVMMTAEVETVIDGKDYCIATLPAFFHHNTARQTKTDYKRTRKDRVLSIKNYLLARSRNDKNPYAVVACEDLADMEKMAQEMINEETILDYIGRIYFTGEGAVRYSGRNIKDSMFRLMPAGSNYSLILDKPPFLVGERVER